MTESQVRRILGEPTESAGSLGFVGQRVEWTYEGLGRVVFESNVFSGILKVSDLKGQTR